MIDFAESIRVQAIGHDKRPSTVDVQRSWRGKLAFTGKMRVPRYVSRIIIP